MTPGEFFDVLSEVGVTHVGAVPGSAIRGLIREARERRPPIYTTMNREDNLVSWAAGVHLAGGKPFVLMQNSGLGHIGNALVSLQMTYRLPLVMLVSWQGYEKREEVQHWIWGEIQNPMLDAMQVPYLVLEHGEARGQIVEAFALAERRRWPVALVLRRGGYVDE